MTAEIAILNKSAIALAADSAVTLGGGQGKIYNTVNKLFTLSKYRPVGVMIYGSAEFMGVPFETLIKVYRESLKDTSAKTIEDYANAFIKYLKSTAFASDFQQRTNIRRVWEATFENILDDFRREIREEFQSKGTCSVKKQTEIITTVFDRHLQQLEKLKPANGFEKKNPEKVVKQYNKELTDSRNVIFGAFKISRANQITLSKIAGLIVTSEFHSPSYSGVVIAGFGEDEMFPHVVQTRTDGVIDGVLKWDKWDKDGIEHEKGSIIIPFAQKEMVQRFMEGVDRKYQNFISGAMMQVLKVCVDGVINLHVVGDAAQKKLIRDEVDKSLGKQFRDLMMLMAKYREDNFIDPIVEIVKSLPKDELANLAEALVNLTSIKRRVSTDRETVGGPIDVAVISKGDGFIWIKRKHYFRPELNQHFLRNYLINCVGGDANAKA